jgi:leucyl-tRNA synthetase
LSNAGEITQSEKYLRKASEKVIRKVRKDYIVAQREKANIVLTEALIDKFSDLMEAINMEDSAKELKTELNQDKLFSSDVKSVVGMLSPYIPYLGIVSCGVTTVKHVYRRTPEPPPPPSEEEPKTDIDN